jgi:hypothetical protein
MIIAFARRLERSTLWITLKYQMCSLYLIKGNDISWTTIGLTNAASVSKATMVSKMIVATM